MPTAVYVPSEPFTDVRSFGTRADGVTDDTAAIQAAINAVGVGGGTVFFAPGTYLVSGQLTFPNDGGTPPKQMPICLVGAGGLSHGQSSPPALGGSVLDLQYSGAGVAKLDTRGLGLLVLRDLTLTDGGSDSVPFIQTTNTALQVERCAFMGTGSGQTCLQDALVLGGTSTALDGSSNAAFQGYGTVIRGCYFAGVRRAVTLRTFANGIVIAENWISFTCGSADGGAIEFAPLSGQFCSGNIIRDNVIECTNYVYAIHADWCQHCSFLSNGCYDPSAHTVAYHRLESNAVYNLILPGFGADTKPTLSDVSGSNTMLTMHQSQQTVMTQPWLFNGDLRILSGHGPWVQNANGDTWLDDMTSATVLRWRAIPKVGTVQEFCEFQVPSTTQSRMVLTGSATNFYDGATGATLTMRAGVGQILGLGDANNQVQIQNGMLALKKHLNAQSGADLGGSVTVLSGTASISGTFSTAFTSAPVVVAVPTTDPGSRYWVSTTTTGFTVTLQTAPAANVVFHWLVVGSPS